MNLFKKISYFLSSIVIGTITFITLFIILKFNIFLALILSISIYFSIEFIIKGNKKTPDVVQNNINLWTQKLTNLKNLNRKIKRTEMNKNVNKLVLTFEDFFEYYKQDPINSEIPIIYYLETIQNILKKYLQLESKRIMSTETADTIKKCESIVEKTELNLRKYMSSVDENKIIDLESEVKVLERTLSKRGENYE
jgi:hypothetical protein